MTTGGWLFLVAGWGAVIGLTAWCLYRIATGESPSDEESGGPPGSVPRSTP